MDRTERFGLVLSPAEKRALAQLAADEGGLSQAATCVTCSAEPPASVACGPHSRLPTSTPRSTPRPARRRGAMAEYTVTMQRSPTITDAERRGREWSCTMTSPQLIGPTGWLGMLRPEIRDQAGLLAVRNSDENEEDGDGKH